VTRVLVVDDEPQIRRVLTVNLSTRGYDVTAAQDGTQALLEAARHPPDVVLLDLGLPDIDGLQVIRELRTWTTTPIVVLSARTGSEDKSAPWTSARTTTCKSRSTWLSSSRGCAPRHAACRPRP